MVDRSFAAQRNDQRIITDFPAHPILDRSTACHGLVVIDGLAGQPQSWMLKLLPVREKLAAIWEGVLDVEAGERQLLVILFSEPTNTNMLSLGQCLPLTKAQGRILSAFAKTPSIMEEAPAHVDAESVKQIELWWGGKRHQIAMGMMKRVPLSCLWAMPDLTIHQPYREEISESLEAAFVASGVKVPRRATIQISGSGSRPWTHNGGGVV